MNTYQVSGTARRVGAIGAMEPFSITVTCDDTGAENDNYEAVREKARQARYADGWEHVLVMEVEPILMSTCTTAVDALVEAWKALSIFATSTDASRWDVVLGENDPDSLERAKNAMTQIEQALPVPVLVTILPTYTEVRFAVNGSKVCRGMVRDCAHGRERDRSFAHFPRRITNLDGGFEFFVEADTEFDTFEITKRP